MKQRQRANSVKRRLGDIVLCRRIVSEASRRMVRRFFERLFGRPAAEPLTFPAIDSSLIPLKDDRP